MKIKIWLPVLLLILAFSQTGFAEMGSTNFLIKTSVVSGGGAPMNSTAYSTNSTLGQSVTSDPAASSRYDLYAGFWYTLINSGCIWDLDPDGDVDGMDLYLFIGPGYNPSDIESFGSEYGRRDCFD